MTERLTAAIEKTLAEAPHAYGCEYREHFMPLAYIPFRHRRKHAAKRAELVATAPACTCHVGELYAAAREAGLAVRERVERS